MMANPWAVVVFFILGITLFGFGFTDPLTLTIYFVGFVIAWFAAGYAWDWYKYREK